MEHNKHFEQCRLCFFLHRTPAGALKVIWYRQICGDHLSQRAFIWPCGLQRMVTWDARLPWAFTFQRAHGGHETNCPVCLSATEYKAQWHGTVSPNHQMTLTEHCRTSITLLSGALSYHYRFRVTTTRKPNYNYHANLNDWNIIFIVLLTNRYRSSRPSVNFCSLYVNILCRANVVTFAARIFSNALNCLFEFIGVV